LTRYFKGFHLTRRPTPARWGALAGGENGLGLYKIVDNLWLIGGLAVGTIGFQVAIAGVWWSIGGLGALRRINNSLSKFEDDIHHLDTRLSREQKVRASVAASEARKGGDIKQEAQELLAQETTSKQTGRPGTAHLIAR